MKDTCPKNLISLKFYYVILLEIGVNGWFTKVISTLKAITANPKTSIYNGRGHVELSLLYDS